jgi:hypothetical protein
MRLTNSLLTNILGITNSLSHIVPTFNKLFKRGELSPPGHHIISQLKLPQNTNLNSLFIIFTISFIPISFLWHPILRHQSNKWLHSHVICISEVLSATFSVIFMFLLGQKKPNDRCLGGTPFLTKLKRTHHHT